MDDDFNTTAAIANLYNIFKYANNIIKSSNKSLREKTANTIANLLEEIKRVYGILGLFKQKPEEFVKEMKLKYLSKLGIEVNYIEEKIKERKEAKKNKDYNLADLIREELDNKGILLNDTKDGTMWDIKELY